MVFLEWFRKALGLTNLEKRINQLEEISRMRFKTKPETIEREENLLLRALVGKMSTIQAAKAVCKSRSWVSLLLNKLEKEGKVREAGKLGRTILYERVEEK